VYPWTPLRRLGVAARFVDRVGGSIEPEALLRRIDGRTRVAALNWVQFADGYRTDLVPVGQGCRRRGVVFVVDTIQCLGALRFQAAAEVVAASAGR
jgi:selenocysteine lyase/cysteine desulfurase